MHTAAFVSADFAVGALARKKPLPQASHCVSFVGVPADTVHSPREHVLCTLEHATRSDASLVLSLGAANRNLPLLHVLHCVSVLEVPALAVHSPASHFACAMHTSVTVDLAETKALKKPDEHVAHDGCAVASPARNVYLPAPHFVCRVHVIIPPWYDARTDPASGLHVNGEYFALE